MTGDLAVWLRAQLDAQERWLRKPLKDFMDQCQECGFAQQADGSPYSHAWLLADITAKRAIIDEYQRVCPLPIEERYDVGYECGLERALLLLAQPYAGRPGWHNEWSV